MVLKLRGGVLRIGQRGIRRHIPSRLLYTVGTVPAVWFAVLDSAFSIFRVCGEVLDSYDGATCGGASVTVRIVHSSNDVTAHGSANRTLHGCGSCRPA